MIPVLSVPDLVPATFRFRPNRFLCHADIATSNGIMRNQTVHVHDPGRLKELLYPGNQLLVRYAANPNRKTRWDLIAVNFNTDWVLINSSFHSRIARTILENPATSPIPGIADIQCEKMIGTSRIDFLLTLTNGHRMALEVKGCTLAEEGIALFPDAPTIRGTRHVNELMKWLRTDRESSIVFLVFRKDATSFRAHSQTDPKFAGMLNQAIHAGVNVFALRFQWDDGTLFFDREIPVIFK